jgi:hypothetical protein
VITAEVRIAAGSDDAGTYRPERMISTIVSWSPVPWTTIGQAGPYQRTPDISRIIQEIVEQPGWLSGNSPALIITGAGTRVAESCN